MFAMLQTARARNITEPMIYESLAVAVTPWPYKVLPELWENRKRDHQIHDSMVGATAKSPPEPKPNGAGADLSDFWIQHICYEKSPGSTFELHAVGEERQKAAMARGLQQYNQMMQDPTMQAQMQQAMQHAQQVLQNPQAGKQQFRTL
eukprot:Skav226169  [mRNA]  locus=scaffold2279:225790:226498:- [translate_table: standard]